MKIERNLGALDQVSQQIVAVLQAHPRASWSEVARIIDVSEATVSRRARKLLDGGVLVLSAARNPASDTSSSDVFVMIKCTIGMSRAVAAALVKLDEVRFTAIITGAFDIIAEAAFLSSSELNTFVLDVIAAIPGVESVQTLAVFQNFKTNNAWASGILDAVRFKGFHLGDSGRVAPDARSASDKIDSSLCNELTKSPRVSSAELAARLNLSESVVRRRLDSLIGSGRVLFSAYIAPHLMGFAFEAFLWLDVDASAIDRVARELSELRSVRYVSGTAGSYNLLVEVVFRDRDEIHQFLTVTLGGFDGVRKSELILQLQTIKRNYAYVSQVETRLGN